MINWLEEPFDEQTASEAQAWIARAKDKGKTGFIRELFVDYLNERVERRNKYEDREKFAFY